MRAANVLGAPGAPVTIRRQAHRTGLILVPGEPSPGGRTLTGLDLIGFVFSYEAVRDWEAKLTPALAEDLRRRRRGKVG